MRLVVNSKLKCCGAVSDLDIWYEKNVKKNCLLIILLYFFASLIEDAISLMSRVFGLGDQGSIPGWLIPKTQKMVLDTALLNTQHQG